MKSQLLIGDVQHRRYQSRKHIFNYKVYMFGLHLAELDAVMKRLWCCSLQRFNLLSFKRKKYLGNKNEALLACVQRFVFEQSGQQIDQVFLVTNLACFGYCFNPISLYFCFYQGALKNCIAEVTNTPWGESHRYLLTPQLVKNDIYAMTFTKLLHVSPFMQMDYEYHMRCKYSENAIIVHIKNMRNGICEFDATLRLAAQPLTNKNLIKVLLRFPMMTGKVIFAIYWQALRLWLKGVSYVKPNEHKEKQ